MSDREIVGADVALQGATQMIATELGFASWTDLKESAPMTQTTDPDLRLKRSLANVFVTDFARALAFYRDILGFDVVFTYGEPPFYGEVRRDETAFYLRHVDDSPFVVGVREDQQLLSVSIETTDATSLFLSYQEAGVDFQERLRSKPWGALEFVVRDPDANLILFSSSDRH